MDKAYVGFCRADYCRADVYRDDWDRLLAHFKNVPTKSVGGIDPCVAGAFRAGMFRAGVYVPLFDELKERMKQSG
jgi:hypothetical protein